MLISIVASVFLNNDIDGTFILYITGVLCSGTIAVLAIWKWKNVTWHDFYYDLIEIVKDSIHENS